MKLKKQPFLVVTTVLMVLASCKKDDLVSNNLTPSTPATGLSADVLKDSALFYSKDIYLWYNQIPSSFNARTYEGIDKVMTAIRQYSTEPGFTQPVDRWSFAVKQQEWDNISNGVSGDFGMDVFFRAEGDLRVRLVEKESPAGRAGVKRGWRITAINSNTNITTSNANFIVQNVYESSSGTFTFQRADNSPVTLNLAAASYHSHPVVLDSVYTVNSKKVGYFSFNSFMGDTTEIYNEFSRIFNRFAAAQVSDVVVDLRYNGGGYVSVQQKLANWLVPSGANGQLMMKQQFNDKYTEYNSIDYFQKLGSLNLNRIFFIVGSGTASASELLINNLKPFMDVQLLGPSKTYGKPVGFFPIPVGDWYIFPVSFKSTNKDGQGNYYNGLDLNNQVADGLDKDWGDRTESCLQNALNYITTGAYKMQANNGAGLGQDPSAINNGNAVLLKESFKGAIGNVKVH